MRIEILDEMAVVREADDLKRLSVVADAGTGPGALAAAVAPLGTVDPDGLHVWLRITDLEAAAAATVAESDRAEWVEGFRGMAAYATSKGWTSPDGGSLRAHVEFR